jgi:hypothetical protein
MTQTDAETRKALEQMDEYVKLEEILLSIPGLSSFKLLRGCTMS